MKLSRKTLVAETNTEFTFDVKGMEFLVKNLTAGNIFVSLDSETDTSKMIKVPAGVMQVCVINVVDERNVKTENQYCGQGDLNLNSISTTKVNVIANVGGEVEVQCIKY